MTNKEHFEHCIKSKEKVRFRMDGTPEDKYFLFHPYATILDKFTDEVTVYGLIEKDYLESGEKNNKAFRITMNSIHEVIPTGDKYEPIDKWTEKLKDPMLEFIVTVDK